MDRKLDVKAVVQFFGGQSELTRRLAKQGRTLGVKGIQKWQERGVIPGSWIAKLAELAKSEGRLFELTDFLKAKVNNEQT